MRRRDFIRAIAGSANRVAAHGAGTAARRSAACRCADGVRRKPSRAKGWLSGFTQGLRHKIHCRFPLRTGPSWIRAQGCRLSRKGSLPSARMMRPVGKTVPKNTRTITTGFITLCSIRPNLNQIRLRSLSAAGLTQAKKKNSAATPAVQGH